MRQGVRGGGANFRTAGRGADRRSDGARGKAARPCFARVAVRRNMAAAFRRRFRLFGGVIDQLSADNPEIDTKWAISASLQEERMNRRQGRKEGGTAEVNERVEVARRRHTLQGL